jgi:hypothetical protein
MNPTAADFLTLIGLALTAFGAGRAAMSVILKEDDAITVGVARWASEKREENLKLPAVQNLLQASRGAQQGFWLIVVGTALQILPIITRVLVVTPAMAASDGETYTLYRNSVTDPAMRVHIATFDTNEGKDYNAENCAVAADLFQRQDGVQTRFWCEPSLYRK